MIFLQFLRKGGISTILEEGGHVCNSKQKSGISAILISKKKSVFLQFGKTSGISGTGDDTTSSFLLGIAPEWERGQEKSSVGRLVIILSISIYRVNSTGCENVPTMYMCH